jgi:hypothetical protein
VSVVIITDEQLKGFMFKEYNVHGSVHRNNILIYIQKYATLHSLFYLETALHVSGGTSTHHQERKQLHLKHPVFVTPLPLPVAIAGGSNNGVTNNYIKITILSCMFRPYMGHQQEEV